MKTFLKQVSWVGRNLVKNYPFFFRSRFIFGLIWEHIFVVAMEYGGNIYWKMRNDGKTVINAGTCRATRVFFQ